MKTHVQQTPGLTQSHQGYGALLIRFVLAPLLGLFSGFHTMDFLLGGLYTWPQMSRVIAMTFAVVILSYEFVYKENRVASTYQQGLVNHHGMKAVLFSCLFPYMAGCLALLFLVLFSQ